MIAPGDAVQASYDAVSARADSCGPPRNVPALRAVPLPGNPKQASPAPSPSRAMAATPSPSAAPSPAAQGRLAADGAGAWQSAHRGGGAGTPPRWAACLTLH
jgi:hypothetical protein